MDQKPSKLLFGLEAVRGVYEFGLGHLLMMPLRYICPKGDGHPVIMLPGLGTSDSSTRYIRTFLDDIGYCSYPWGLGRNVGPRNGLDALIQNLSERLDYISEEHNKQPITVIGWSLGGVYGRELAKVNPGRVRQVITIGTPFKGNPGSTNAKFLYEILSKDRSHRDPEVLKKISIPPPVPFTSIYSKTDGVVHWQCSIEDEGPFRENVEVPGASHIGLGYNPISIYIIANRLKQTKENWKPYNL